MKLIRGCECDAVHCHVVDVDASAPAKDGYIYSPDKAPYRPKSMKRLKQPTKRGEQLRMFAKDMMPGELIAPLEKDVVDETRAALEKLGYLTWSGRIAIYDATPEAREARIARGWPLFLPVLGPGTSDVLGVMPERAGRFFAL
jgi:hypothetical protein